MKVRGSGNYDTPCTYVVPQCGRIKANFHYAIQLELAASRAGHKPASELDSVMEFGLPGAIQLAIGGLQPADLVLDLSQTGSRYLDMSRKLKPGHRLVHSWFGTSL